MTRPLRVGIVGCGNVALNFHVPAYLSQPDRFELVGLADPTPERLELGRTTAGLTVEQVHLTPTDLLRREDIDIVDVCTPQHLRRDLLIAAAELGKHILTEKPIASVPADAAAAVAAADRAGIVLAVVHNYLFFPEIVAARSVIDSGELGEIRTVRVDMLGVVDSPGAAGYRPQWRHDPRAAGGGVLMDMLHGVYLAEYLLGAPFRRSSAFVDNAADGDQVEGLALCRFESDRGAALVNVAWGVGNGGIQVVGTKGRLSIRYREDGTPPWAPFQDLTVTSDDGTGRLSTRTLDLPAGQELPELIRDAMAATVRDLADAVELGNAPAATGAHGMVILEATLAAYGSAALGRTITLPLAADHPLHLRGVIGLQDMDVPDDSPVRARALFGFETVPAAMELG